MEAGWFVYLLECGDGTLYTGVATDVARRLEQHREGKGARYTRGRGPIELVAERGPMSRSEALRLELEIKKLRREDKAKALAEAG